MSLRLVPLTKGFTVPIPLQRPVLLVGRHPECDVRIESSKISRRHCCLGLAYDRVLIRDLGSRNGLRVNGRLVQEARLEPNDELAIGPLLFRLENEQTPEQTPTVRAVPESKPTPRPATAKLPVAKAPAPLAFLGDPDDDLVPLDDL